MTDGLDTGAHARGVDRDDYVEPAVVEHVRETYGVGVGDAA